MNPFTFRTAVAILLITPPAFAAQFKFPNQTFAVPDAFEVELAAGPPLVERPVSASFDDQGRLYVTDSSGSNEKPDKQLANPPHRVLRLEDTDNDGRFDESVVFADKVMFPQGCLWHAGSVYVAGPPSIWKFTDTDGDGIADKRQEWFKGGTLTGCANDIHGPYLGPDGYLYWTKGAFAEQTHTLANGRKINDRAAHIYRARPDGSDLDIIMSGGMDNPVEVAFTPEGETIFTSTFIDFSQPGYRDGIAHAVYGAVFGKQHDALEDGRLKRAGPDLMHPFYQAGNAAECGLCRYESAVFGAEYRDNFFATTFNLHKVTRHILRLKGATFASTDSDFLVSDSVDFHPTDVLEDADGSLIVVDTGGWYKLCCPSSQLAKPDVLGAIYRVRKKGTPKLTAKTRHAAYVRLVQPPNLTGQNATATLARAARDPRPENRAAFVEALAAYGKSQDDANAQAARAAAEGLGRLRDKESVRFLLETVGFCGQDLVLEQSLIRALIDIDDRDDVLSALSKAGQASRLPPQSGAGANNSTALPEVAARVAQGAGGTPALLNRAALIALDQMDGGDLRASEVLPFLSAPDQRLRAAANWVVGHHPDWGGALAAFFRERLSTQNLSETDREELQRQLAQLTRDAAIQELVGEVSGNPAASKETRLVALHAMAQASIKETPGAWTNTLPRTLAEADDTIVQAAIAVVRALPVAKTNAFDFSAQLLRVGRDLSRAAELRLDALSAMREGLNSIEPELFDFLRSNLDSARPPATRTTAATVVGRAKLSDEQLLALADGLKTIGPLEISRLIEAFNHTRSEAIGLRLVAALNESKGFSGLRADVLKPLLEKYSATVQEQGKALLVRLDVDLEKQKAHLDEMLASLPAGDIRRGQAVFNSPKTACLTCHAIGYVGGHVGPDLTNIGQARTERDLLESVIYPSASFVRSYEPMIVVTKSGDEYSGVIRRDAPDEVLLATGPNTETRVARSEIGEMRPGTVSIMPAGLDEQLSRQELADLVTFLKATKW